MIKIIEILNTNSFDITCKFNNGEIATLDVLPLLENHKHLIGIEKLKEKSEFAKVRIGKMGELVWDKIIKSKYNEQEYVLDYDISPEFAFFNSIKKTT